jgi:methionyl-tRNA formyltransferase
LNVYESTIQHRLTTRRQSSADSSALEIPRTLSSPTAAPSRPRTVFFCGDQSPYGRAHLRPIIESFDVVGVVTATPARWAKFREVLSGVPHEPPSGLRAGLDRLRRARRKRRPGYIDVPAIVRASKAPRLESFDVNSGQSLDQIRALSPDLILSAAYPQIFGAELLGIAPLGAINFHPSLLPRFRGAHPHFWAVATGAATTGITAHFMTPRIDDGDVIAQIEFPIGDLTYSQVYHRIVQETPTLVREVAEFCATPVRSGRPQNPAQATFFRNDRDIHRRIFWRMHRAEHIRNLCRTEQAFCFFQGQKLIPLHTSVEPGNRNLTNGVDVESGTIVDVADGTVVVKANDGCVVVRKVRLGGKELSCDRWARRNRLKIGEQLS